MANRGTRRGVTLLVLAGLWAAPASTSAAVAAPTVVHCVSPDSNHSAYLKKAVTAAMAASEGAAIGLYDRNTDTTCYHLRDRRFYTASVAKVLAATALQWRAQQEGRPLDPTTEDRLVREMITSPVDKVSNNAAEALWEQLHLNGAYVTDVINKLGMADTRPARQLGRTETTARDQVTLMKSLTSPGRQFLERDRREYILQRMTEIPSKHQFGVPNNAPARWYNKFGYLRIGDGLFSRVNFVTHSVGAVRGQSSVGKSYDYVLAILTDRNPPWRGSLRVSSAAVAINGAMRLMPGPTQDPLATPDSDTEPVTLAEAEKAASQRTSCQTVTISSLANNRLVSAELGWTGDRNGMLRARAATRGAWERYQVCFDGVNSTILSFANGRYLSAELGWDGDQGGMLRARSTTAGPWERFSFASCGADCVTIRSTANGLYVSAELGWSDDNYGMLRARAAEIGEWERFR